MPKQFVLVVGPDLNGTVIFIYLSYGAIIKHRIFLKQSHDYCLNKEFVVQNVIL